MTPKEKAIEIYSKIYNEMFAHWDVSECEHTTKQCALICIEEIIEQFKIECYDGCGAQLFWIEVKKEIELL